MNISDLEAKLNELVSEEEGTETETPVVPDTDTDSSDDGFGLDIEIIPMRRPRQSISI